MIPGTVLNTVPAITCLILPLVISRDEQAGAQKCVTTCSSSPNAHPPGVDSVWVSCQVPQMLNMKIVHDSMLFKNLFIN